MSSVLFQITRKCNLSCRHCAYSCGPNGKTASRETVKAVVESLDRSGASVLISGGEPFAVPDMLYFMLGLLKETNKRRQTQLLLPLSYLVDTNGFWAQDETQAYDTLRRLHSFGVSYFCVSSFDKYHVEQGINWRLLEFREGTPLFNASYRMSREVAGSQWHPVQPVARGPLLIDDPSKVIPFGRGASLPQEEWQDSTRCWAMDTTNFDSYHVSLDPDGNVFPCCWMVTPSMGNANEQDITAIVAGAFNDPLRRALIEGGPREYAKLVGLYDPKDDPIYKDRPCLKCKDFFLQQG